MNRFRTWICPIGAALAAGFAFGAPATLAATTAVPRASDYHSLLLSGRDDNELLLGTHNGLSRSRDGGRTWTSVSALAGRDVMSLARAGHTIWAAGHGVLVKSSNDGRTWTDVRPRGLPSLDVHGFAVSADSSRTLYAQIAGQGLYRSRDNARTFQLLSAPPNGAGMIMALAVSSSGSLFAGDMQNGIFRSQNGRTWHQMATGMAMALAVDPRDPNRVIATTNGIAISTDSGRNWKMALRSKVMFGPVAWSPRNARVAYAVAYDRSLWRTANGGKSWKRVG